MSALYESQHPYYCTGGCYYVGGADRDRVHQELLSWADFLEAWGDADLDYNLLFRWDWKEGSDWGIPDGACQLQLFYFLQRKAYPCSVFVYVRREQEPEIRAWLSVRFQHLLRMWAPLGEDR